MPDERKEMDELLARQDKHKANLKVINELLESEGWKWLADVLTTNIGVQRRNELESTLYSLDDAFRSAQLRGQIRGMSIAATTPLTYREGLEADLAQVNEEIERAQDE